MRAKLQCRPQMFDSRLASADVKRTRLEQNIRPRFFEPLANVKWRQSIATLRQEVSLKNGKRVQSIGIGDPAQPASGHSRESPMDVIAPAELGFLRNKQAEERASHVAHADDGEIIGGHGSILHKEGAGTGDAARPDSTESTISAPKRALRRLH